MKQAKSPEIILDILNAAFPTPLAPCDIEAKARASGTPLPSKSALWASLSRLAKQGLVSREGHGRYRARPV